MTRFAANSTRSGPLEANGFVKGRDFVQFYVAGALAAEGRWRDLYDVGALKHAVTRIVPPAAGDIPAPVYGPQVALFFSPWSALPYLEARWWWLALSAAAYLTAAALVMATVAPLHGFRILAWITLLCNPAFAMMLSTGQTGGAAVLFWALATVAAAKRRGFLFGAGLGLLTYKPPLLIGVVPPLLILRWWQALAGIVISALGQLTATVFFTGLQPWWYYLDALRTVSRYHFLTDTIPHHKQSVSGFLELLLGPGALSAILTAVGAAAILGLWWIRRNHPRTEWLPVLVCPTAVLLSPHFYVYDLIVFTPALLVAADRLALHRESFWERTLLAAGYGILFAPFSGALALHSRVQLSTLAVGVFLVGAHKQWQGTPRASLLPRSGL